MAPTSLICTFRKLFFHPFETTVFFSIYFHSIIDSIEMGSHPTNLPQNTIDAQVNSTSTAASGGRITQEMNDFVLPVHDTSKLKYLFYHLFTYSSYYIIIRLYHYALIHSLKYPILLFSYIHRMSYLLSFSHYHSHIFIPFYHVQHSSSSRLSKKEV